MNGSPPPALRTVAFGDLGISAWGAGWFGADGTATFAVVGAGDGARPLSLQLEGARAAEEWQLRGEGAELLLTPEGEVVDLGGSRGQPDGFEQLCRVTGRLALAGPEQSIECLGRRGARATPIDFGRIDSIREVSAWFGAAEGLAVLALRPRGARGHEAEVLSAALFEPDGPIAVADPRMSTTYAATGRPARVGLELWLDGDDDEQQYPRRAAGEATGAAAQAAMNELDVLAELFRWHSRGQEGAGVYLLGRKR